jgi:hypothetical protein
LTTPAAGKRTYAPRRHDRRSVHDSPFKDFGPTSCRRPNRPAIKNGFCHYAAEKFVWILYGLRGYEDPKQTAPTFAALWKLIDAVHFADDETRERATRSDFLQSICLVVYCILSRFQIRSGRVGFDHQKRDNLGRKHDMVGLSRSAIAEWCQISERTVSLVFTLLRRAGLVHGPSRTDKANHIAQPCEQDDDTTEWLPAVRKMQFVFFAELGLGPWLAGLRKPPAKPDAPATVQVKTTRRGKWIGSNFVAELADVHALDGPPDG